DDQDFLLSRFVSLNQLSVGGTSYSTAGATVRVLMRRVARRFSSSNQLGTWLLRPSSRTCLLSSDHLHVLTESSVSIPPCGSTKDFSLKSARQFGQRAASVRRNSK